MQNSLEELHLRLKAKGFTPVEIQGLTKDVLIVLSNGRHGTRDAVNREMEDLGWGIEILDKVTYNLANSLRLNNWERCD
jgi:hypothetical protein